MDLAGIDVGKESDNQFGPITAAGSLKYVIKFPAHPHLVHGFSSCILGVCTTVPGSQTVAAYSAVYRSDGYDTPAISTVRIPFIVEL